MNGTLSLESNHLYLTNGTDRRMLAVIAFADLPIAQEICLRCNDYPALVNMVGQERIKSGNLLGENRRLRAFKNGILEETRKLNEE